MLENITRREKRKGTDPPATKQAHPTISQEVIRSLVVVVLSLIFQINQPLQLYTDYFFVSGQNQQGIKSLFPSLYAFPPGISPSLLNTRGSRNFNKCLTVLWVTTYPAWMQFIML